MQRLALAVSALLVLSLPAMAEIPPGMIQNANANAGSQAIRLGVTGWLQMTPAFTHHVLMNLTVPIVQMPWHAIIEAIPTVGTGSLVAGYLFQPGPLTITPGIGLRYFGATGGPTDGFLYGPQAKLGARLQILPWLNLAAGMAYAPWLPVLNKTGAGSYADFSASLGATFGRMTYSLGYLGYLVDAANPGLAAFQTPLVGGPTAGIAFAF
ncbi:MAG: hypothetical protein H7338_25465 [Candidatus Sericytochromatia bacterium]|nr:hypothetical protein [Candidatus Sericytochromatia bacterium]